MSHTTTYCALGCKDDGTNNYDVVSTLFLGIVAGIFLGGLSGSKTRIAECGRRHLGEINNRLVCLCIYEFVKKSKSIFLRVINSIYGSFLRIYRFSSRVTGCTNCKESLYISLSAYTSPLIEK